MKEKEKKGIKRQKMEMKTLLIHQPYRFDLNRNVVPIIIPRNLLVIGACLLSKGHQVKIHDMQINNLGPESIPPEMEKYKPGMVGISIHAAPFIPAVKACCESIKAHNPRIPIVVGGIFTSSYKGKIFKEIPELDIIVLNEGEETVVELAEAINNGKSLDSIKGIIYKNEKGEIIETAERPMLANVKTSPIPAYELIDLGAYKKNGALPPPIEAQRGCPYSCKFCGVHYPNWGKKVRFKDVDVLIKEIELLNVKYGFNQFFFTDEIITLNPDYIGEICKKLIAKNLHKKMKWTGYSRADRINPELAGLMAEAGCTCLAVGVETGSQEQLDTINKNATLTDYRKGIQVIKDAGIDVHALIIIGFPEVNHKDIQMAARFLVEMRPSVTQFFIFHPVPGTDFFSDPFKYGLLYKVDKLEDWYKFDFIEEPLCDTRHLTREEIIKYFLLYNLAFNSFENFGEDYELQKRLLQDDIPRRRKGVVIARTGKLHLCSAPFPPDGTKYTDLFKNTRVISELQYEILLRCNGDFTVEEIARYVAVIYNLPVQEASRAVISTLRDFETSRIINPLQVLQEIS